MTLRTALQYKYNPTVRYSLELSRDNQSVGTLRVSLRTQNSRLIMAMVNFYGLWDTVETAFLGRQQSMVDGERYLRVLVLQSTGPQGLLLGSEALGELIADYIATFDAALKFYFSAPEPQSPAVRQEVERLYREYYERRNIAV